MEKFFKDRGFEVVRTREPGGTPLAEEIREMLLRRREEHFPVKAEVLLFFTSRLVHVENLIIPALKRGAIVLSDRFVDSTYAYQAARGDIPREVIEEIDRWTLNGFRPDLTFLFDVAMEVGLSRVCRRGAKDRIEGAIEDFFQKAHLAYLGQYERDPQRYQLIDANQSMEEVQSQLLPHLCAISVQLKATALQN